MSSIVDTVAELIVRCLRCCEEADRLCKPAVTLLRSRCFGNLCCNANGAVRVYAVENALKEAAVMLIVVG